MAESAKDDNPLVGFIEADVELNSSADDVYDIFQSKCYLFPRLMPETFQKVELLEPEWNSVGSMRRWTFVDAGKCGIWTDVVKAIDNRTKSITWILVEGELPKKLYCNLKMEFHFSQQCGRKAHLKLTYEKKDATVPVPDDYMKFIIGMVKKADKNPLQQ